MYQIAKGSAVCERQCEIFDCHAITYGVKFKYLKNNNKMIHSAHNLTPFKEQSNIFVISEILHSL